MQRLSLSAAQGFLLGCFDGRMTVAEVADVYGMGVAEIFPLADHLVACGALRAVGAEPAPTVAPRVELSASRHDAKLSPRVGRASKSVAPQAAADGPRSRRTVAPGDPGAAPKRETTRPTKAALRRRTTVKMEAVRPTAPTKPAATRGRASIAPPPSARQPPPRARASTKPPPSVPSRRARASTKPPPSAASPSRARATRPPRTPASATPPAPPKGIDEAVLARIMTFEASLQGVDHYAVLGVARGAERAAIKQAYFKLASEFHPDRHFGKALGAAGPALQRVFVRLTQASDVLTNRARRAEYDATLPSLPSPAPVASPQPAPRTGSRRRSTAARIAAAVVDTIPAPPPVQPTEPPVVAKEEATVAPAPSRVSPLPVTIAAPGLVSPLASSLPPAMRASGLPGVGSSAPPTLSSPAPRVSTVPAGPSSTAAPASAGRGRTEDALYRFYRSARREESARRVAVFRDIAEAALARHDLVVAAQHFRFVLENDDDPIVRAKLVAIEEALDGEARKASKPGR